MNLTFSCPSARCPFGSFGHRPVVYSVPSGEVVMVLCPACVAKRKLKALEEYNSKLKALQELWGPRSQYPQLCINKVSNTEVQLWRFGLSDSRPVVRVKRIATVVLKKSTVSGSYLVVPGLPAYRKCECGAWLIPPVRRIKGLDFGWASCSHTRSTL